MKIQTSLPKGHIKKKEAATEQAPKEAAAAASETADQVQLDGEAGKKDWTVLVWANGKSNGADRLAPSVMRELEVAGSDENMDIVAQLGRKGRIYDKVTKDWSGVRRYHVQRNEDPPSMQQELMKWFLPPYTEGIQSPVLEDMGNIDMGSSANLSEFLQWGMKEYPAKNYAVIIYGEGGGMAGAGIDEEFGQRLTPEGVAQAMREATIATGEDIDLIAFDADHMGGVEVAHQLKDVADIMVASEGAMNLGSIQLDMVMKDLKFELAEKGEVTPEQLAKWFVFETMANPGPMAEMVNPTLSAIDLKKMDGVKDAYANVASELAKALKDKPLAKDALRQAIGETTAYAANQDSSAFYGDYRDIGHFAQNLKGDKRLGEDVHKAADALIKATQGAVIDQAAHGPFANSSGLTGYLPLDAGFDLHSTWKAPRRGMDPLHGYNDTSVAQGSQWGEVLKTISEETPFNRRLRSMGLDNAGIVKARKSINFATGLFKKALGLSSNIGTWHAQQMARGKAPGAYFGIPPSVGVPMGVVGGARNAFFGGKLTVSAIRDKGLANKRQAITDGVLDTVQGLAVGTAAVGHLFPQAEVVKRPAAMVAFGAPFVKMANGIISTRKAAVRAKEEAAGMTPDQRLMNLQSAGERKHHYIPPIVKFLSNVASAGSLDMSKAKN